MKNLMKTFYRWLFFWTLKRMSKCANSSSINLLGDRWENTIQLEKAEVFVRVTDTTKDVRYGREELYHMLQIIRREEALTGWTVPEPV